MALKVVIEQFHVGRYPTNDVYKTITGKHLRMKIELTSTVLVH